MISIDGVTGADKTAPMRRLARKLGLMVAAVLVVSCTAHSAPGPSDMAWSAAVYNRTQSAVFLFRPLSACSALHLSAADTMATGVVPSGVTTVGPIEIVAPRGYTGTVSVVITAVGDPQITMGDVAESSLPPCEGMRQSDVPRRVARSRQ